MSGLLRVVQWLDRSRDRGIAGSGGGRHCEYSFAEKYVCRGEVA